MPPENIYLATDSYARREERNKMKSKLRLIADLMQYSIPYYSHFVRILNARIPIIKFRFDLAPIDIDLSLELSSFSSGFFMSSCLSHCHQVNPCVRNLIQLLRIWAKQHGIQPIDSIICFNKF
jgi:DNA polymerase sigma